MAEHFRDIKIIGVVVAEVGTPKNDGTKGSGLYAVPFELSREAPVQWAKAFQEAWDTTSTKLHRPGTCKVREDRVVLAGTTIDEVEKTHMETLRLAVKAANERTRAALAKTAQDDEARKRQESEHLQHVRQVAERLDFDQDGDA
jgi:hypothetical protein